MASSKTKTASVAKTDKMKVLNLLRKAGTNKPVSARFIAARAKMNYRSVSKRIHDLRVGGVTIWTESMAGVGGSKTTKYMLGQSK